MRALRFRQLSAAAAVICGAASVAIMSTGPAAAAAQSGAGGCSAHPFSYSQEYPISYTGGCGGHDEPELDPVSSAAGSAQDLTWTAVLPRDGTVPVSSVSPTFWWGGTVTDPNPHSLFGQGFLEVQFYPDAIVTSCTATGNFKVTYAPNKFTVCAPVWQVSTLTNKENAAFNAELFDGTSSDPLVMSAGDTITVHFFVASRSQGWNVHVTDVTTGHSGTIVLNSRYGPMLPAYDRQQIGDALKWGIVHDTPNAFVWEIGHKSEFVVNAGRFCTPGQFYCDSYDAAHWLGFSPLEIRSVSFGDGSTPAQWAVVSDFGGIAEVKADCKSYGGPNCIYPWFAFNGSANAITYGVDYPGTQFDYGRATQFATTAECGGPSGPESTYCDTVLSPTP